ncbi:MAG: hypothetical protein ACRDDZ_01390 [Marinifilaceae bacterium]
MHLDKRIAHYTMLLERASSEIDKTKRGSFKYIELVRDAKMYREKIKELLVEKNK